MPGQCYGCGDGYGLMKKEHSCKNCGFSYCSKCLPFKIEIPKLNYEKHSACKKCHDFLSGKSTQKDSLQKFSPPEAYKKRVAMLNKQISLKNEEQMEVDTDQQNKPTISKNLSQKIKPKYRGLSLEDMEIAGRLERLKETSGGSTQGVTDQQLRQRLSKLDNKEPNLNQSAAASGENQPFYIPPKNKTQQEEMDDLLGEISNEVKLDSQLPDPTKEIEARLARLKDQPIESTSRNQELTNNLNRPTVKDSTEFKKNIESSDSRDDNENLDEINQLIAETSNKMQLDAQKALNDLSKDEEIMNVLREVKKKKDNQSEDMDTESDDEETRIKQIVEKAELEKDSSDIDDDDDGELPWCVMCNEDAKIRCHGCDLDLYCSRCFKESHDELGMTDHQTSKFVNKTKKRDLDD